MNGSGVMGNGECRMWLCCDEGQTGPFLKEEMKQIVKGGLLIVAVLEERLNRKS